MTQLSDSQISVAPFVQECSGILPSLTDVLALFAPPAVQALQTVAQPFATVPGLPSLPLWSWRLYSSALPAHSPGLPAVLREPLFGLHVQKPGIIQPVKQHTRHKLTFLCGVKRNALGIRTWTASYLHAQRPGLPEAPSP